MAAPPGDIAAFCARPAAGVARDLLGSLLVVGACAGRIVEVEYYTPDDPASHSHRGPTARNAAMFGPPGLLYVYRSYGLHFCANVVCGHEGEGSAVLIRALEPTAGCSVMARRRRVDDVRRLCAGPGRLCEALGIDGTMDGTSLTDGPVRLVPGPSAGPVVRGPRIGISRAVTRPWRLGIAGSRYLSRPFPKEELGER